MKRKCLLEGCKVCQWGICLSLFYLLGASISTAQVNIWTKSTSGDWEEPFWSLGQLPGSNQTVMFTNAGWKALAIGTNASHRYPGSLSLQNLTILASSNSMNTLVLNFLGRETPLRLADRLTVGLNGVLQVLDSGIRVGDFWHGTMFIDGTVNQGHYSEIIADSVILGSHGNARYNLSNGWFYTTYMEMGSSNNTSAVFIQQDGTNRIMELQMYEDALFALQAGKLVSSLIVVGQDSSPRIHASTMTQSGGELSVRELIVGSGPFGQGYFGLTNGLISSTSIRLGVSTRAAGQFAQYGGTNLTEILSISEGPSEGYALPGSYESYYSLWSGLLETTQTLIGAGRNALFTQGGGRHSAGSGIFLNGDTAGAGYLLYEGQISSPIFRILYGYCEQSGGTNEISSTLDIGLFDSNNAYYRLTGGTLCSAATRVYGKTYYEAAFTHESGIHVVTNTLFVSSAYLHNGGELRAQTLQLSGRFFEWGGTSQIGQIMFQGGSLEITKPTNKFGTLQLYGSGTIRFPSSACFVAFGESSSLYWDDYTRLNIEGWQGCTTGGGMHQLSFGTNSGGLTARQLTRLVFVNPLGCSAGMYPARKLQSGEIVPAPWPMLVLHKVNGEPSLSWEEGWMLQISTNVMGPYFDVLNAFSPYTISSDPGAALFFRLRN